MSILCLLRKLAAPILSFTFIAIAYAQAKAPAFVEGVLPNGSRIVVAADTMHTTTTIVLALPRRYTLGYQQLWSEVIRKWTNGSPYRLLYHLPTPDDPYLLVHDSREDDYDGLRALLTSIRETNWTNRITVANESQWPDPAWFYGKAPIRGIVPHPSEFIVGVAGISSTTTLWSWAERAIDQWEGKAGIYRMPPVDTVGHNWYRHRPGERTEIVMWQPVPLPFSKPDAVLRNEIATKRLERNLVQKLHENRIEFTDFATGLYPENSPQWIWCAISGSASSTNAFIKELPYAWLDVVNDPTLPVLRKKAVENNWNRDQMLVNRCLAKMYATPVPPADSTEYRNALISAIRPDRWTILLTTDTTRTTVSEPFHYHP